MWFDKQSGYTDSLRAPDSFRINRIAAATYSLEPQTVFLLACMFELSESGALFPDLSMVRCLASFAGDAAVKKLLAENRLTIFYQHNKFSFGLQKTTDVFAALIRKCCIPVKCEGMSFHPKLILVEYTDGESFRQRLIASSKNLSMSGLYETQIILERTGTERLEAGTVSDINSFISYINSSDGWELMDKESCPFAAKSASVYVQTPLSDKTFYDMMGMGDENAAKLILSPFYSDKDSLEIKNARFYCGLKSEFSPRALHSKLYCVTKNGASSLWAGSANCTLKGLGKAKNRNYECMVRLDLDGDASEDFGKWLADNFIEKITAERITAASEKNIIEEIIEAYDFSCEYDSGKITLTKALKAGMKESDFGRIFVSLPGLNDARYNVKFQGDTCVFGAVPRARISDRFVLKYINDGQYISRLITADCSGQTAQDIEQCAEELSKLKLKNIIPDIIPRTGSRAIYPNSEDASDKPVQNSGDVFSQKDSEYEKVVKLYACGYTEHLECIREVLDKNRDAYDGERVDKVISIIDSLINGGAK